MQHRQILTIVLVVSILTAALSAYSLWAIARRQFERRNEFGVQMFKSARQAFWTMGIEDMLRRSAAVAFPASALAAAVSGLFLFM
jgi:hypothetical protein